MGGLGRPNVYEAGPNSYQLRFEAIGVTVKAERVRAMDETAELSFSTDLDGRIKHPSKLNLRAATTQASLAKLLKESYPEVDWRSVVDNSCQVIVEIIRQGAPVVDLATVQPVYDLEYLVDPLIVENQANVVYGPGETGKSLLGVTITAMIASGYSALGLKTKPRVSLYLDYETNETEIGTRMHMICAGLGMPLPEAGTFHYREQTISVVDDAESIAQACFDYGVKFLCLDSVGAAVSKFEDTKSGPINELHNVLRSLKITTLLIDHVTKDKENMSMYGNVYKWNRGRNIWRAVPSLNSKIDGATKMALFHEKGNTVPKYAKPIGINFKFTPLVNGKRMIATERVEVSTDSEFIKSVPLRVRIREYIKGHGGSATIDQMIEDGLTEGLKADVPANTLYQAMKRDDKLVKLNDGSDKWGLRYDASKEFATGTNGVGAVPPKLPF